MSPLLLFVAAFSQAVRPAPSVPPVDGATGRATVTIISAVAIAGRGLAAPTQAHHARMAELRLADGSARPTLTYEFE